MKSKSEFGKNQLRRSVGKFRSIYLLLDLDDAADFTVARQKYALPRVPSSDTVVIIGLLEI